MKYVRTKYGWEIDLGTRMLSAYWPPRFYWWQRVWRCLKLGWKLR